MIPKVWNTPIQEHNATLSIPVAHPAAQGNIEAVMQAYVCGNGLTYENMVPGFRSDNSLAAQVIALVESWNLDGNIVTYSPYRPADGVSPMEMLEVHHTIADEIERIFAQLQESRQPLVSELDIRNEREVTSVSYVIEGKFHVSLKFLNFNFDFAAWQSGVLDNSLHGKPVMAWAESFVVTNLGNGAAVDFSKVPGDHFASPIIDISHSVLPYLDSMSKAGVDDMASMNDEWLYIAMRQLHAFLDQEKSFASSSVFRNFRVLFPICIDDLFVDIHEWLHLNQTDDFASLDADGKLQSEIENVLQTNEFVRLFLDGLPDYDTLYKRYQAIASIGVGTRFPNAEIDYDVLERLMPEIPREKYDFIDQATLARYFNLLAKFFAENLKLYVSRKAKELNMVSP